MEKETTPDKSEMGNVDKKPKKGEGNWRQKLETRKEMLQYLESVKISDSGSVGRRYPSH